MEFRFAPFVDPNNKELKLETHSLTLTVDGPFASGTRAWRQAFGSLFTAKVTFNIRGDIVQSGPRRHDEQQPGDIEFRIWPVALFASNYTATNCSLSVL